MNFITSEHSDKPWLIKQRWSDVLFYHFKLNPAELQKLVPFKLDLYENQAFVSIVPFKMSHIEIRRVPKPLTNWSSLWELNLRTYVIVDGVPGIYFFTLDATSLLGVSIAKIFFHLPYFYAQCSMLYENGVPDTFLHQRKDYSFVTHFKITDEKLEKPIDTWLTERYSLFTKNKDQSYRGIVSHQPWSLNQVEVISMNDKFSSLIGQHFKKSDIASSSYCSRLDVSFQPFQKID